MTHRELLGRMDSAELSEWLAFDNEFSLPDHYTTAGLLSAVIAGTVPGAKRVSPADFLPYFKAGAAGPKRRQTPAEMKARMMQVSAAQNARV
jgi:hypothetical protein